MKDKKDPKKDEEIKEPIIKKAIINEKEYILNDDGTPSFGVCVLTNDHEDSIKKSLKCLEKYYSIHYNIDDDITNLEILFVDVGQNGLTRQQLYGLFKANSINLKTIILYPEQYKNQILNITDFVSSEKKVIEIKNDNEIGKNIRSNIAKHSYGLKLKSDTWETLKEQVKKDADYRCRLCNASKEETVLVIHHRTYETQGTDKEFFDLCCLCRSCHERFHNKL